MRRTHPSKTDHKMQEFPDISDFAEQVEDLIDMGLNEEAQKLLEGHAVYYPEDWEIDYLYYRIFTEQDRTDDAIRHLRRALSLDPSNPDCLLGLFYTYAQLGNMKKAARYLMSAERHHPDNEQVLSALIWYFGEINKRRSRFSTGRKKTLSKIPSCIATRGSPSSAPATPKTRGNAMWRRSG
jgi:tetratricopeptide (TPR) repeat protein